MRIACIFRQVRHIFDTTFRDYQIEKGSRSVPDVSIHLEKTDENSKRPLSPRVTPGSDVHLVVFFGWLRCVLMSRLGCRCWGRNNRLQHKLPKQVLERFFDFSRLIVTLFSACHPVQSCWILRRRLGRSIFTCGLMHRMLHIGSTNGKALVGSGQVMFFEESLVRAVAKQQQATSLSSCESELYSIQQAAQDAVSVSKVLER